jgi:hypothetical protein
MGRQEAQHSAALTGAPSSNAARIFMALIAVAGWIGLLLQLPLTLANCRALGMSTIAGIAAYLSFFTIVTNLIVAVGLSFSLCLPESPWGRFFSRPGVTAATTAYIVLVGAVYSLLLRHAWDPEGMQKVADILLHDVVPLLYVVCWLIFLPKSRLPWKTALSWLVYPLVYLVFVFSRGALTMRYPYYFIDVPKLGYPRVLLHSALLLCAVLVLGLVVIAISRWLSRTPTSPPPNAA